MKANRILGRRKGISKSEVGSGSQDRVRTKYDIMTHCNMILMLN